MNIKKIISGGQSGVDRGALDFAIEHGIEHGGWVPKGRIAEDGTVPDRYRMKEHASSAYPPRTEANVMLADATVIFLNEPLNKERGCLLTLKLCNQWGKPCQTISLSADSTEKSSERLRSFLLCHAPEILNVAGARGSRNPDIGKMKEILHLAIFGVRL